jgi:hypothetical protein
LKKLQKSVKVTHILKTVYTKNSVIQIDILNDEDYFKSFYNQKYELLKKQPFKVNFK